MDKLLERLKRPRETVDVVLDTDAYNEIDDQFALAYLLHASEKLRVKALYAAPFFNQHSSSPADGMEKSYKEILHILRLDGRQELEIRVFRGAVDYLTDERTPSPSDAASDLATRAMAYTPEKPLYVLTIGAMTNVASALLLQPDIASRIVLVSLAGHALHWPDTAEFNMKQDVAAARVLFGCGAALVQLPCLGVVDMLRTTGPELRHWLGGQNALCDYLCEHTVREAEAYAAGQPWSRVIWDVAAVAWLLDADERMLSDRLIPAPIPEYDHHYGHDPRRHFIRSVYHVDRDAIFADLFAHLRGER